ncbi:hypothetical protein [Rahnella sp. ChDrAdgB13]|uniref:hypothetical protein n=1 Tax=Rahnella sp. ChDrAdgB13 TaxID=1850581 RepID=UPI001AD867BE|nr:hypothetical protein [Rahnella sp. ChDrAdgB13]
MNYSLILLLGSALSFSACSTSLNDHLYAKVENAIKTQDRSAISDVEYDQISENIQRGNSKWIALYPKLSSEPFLGVTAFQEGLDIDLAFALPENADDTLKQVTTNNIDQVCSMPFIEPTRNSIYRYYERTHAALMKIGAPGQKCLSVLDTEMQSLKMLDSQGKIEWGEGEY